MEIIHPFSWAKIIVQEVFGDLRLLVRERKKKEKLSLTAVVPPFQLITASPVA